MEGDARDSIRERVDEVYRTESRRVLATLIRLLGDFDLAEEALHDAFMAAIEQWTAEACPPTRGRGSSPPAASNRLMPCAGAPASTRRSANSPRESKPRPPTSLNRISTPSTAWTTTGYG
jgi:hypothetical protein